MFDNEYFIYISILYACFDLNQFTGFACIARAVGTA